MAWDLQSGATNKHRWASQTHSAQGDNLHDLSVGCVLVKQLQRTNQRKKKKWPSNISYCLWEHFAVGVANVNDVPQVADKKCNQ